MSGTRLSRSTVFARGTYGSWLAKGDQHADFAFAYGAREGPRAFVSTIKLRQAGFTKTVDMEDSFRNALQCLIDRNLLPPAAK
jgi:hypothetical protein